MRHPDFAQEKRISRRPHLVAPHLASVKVVMAIHRHHHHHPAPYHHTDSGIAIAINGTARCLRRGGVEVLSWAVINADDLSNKLEHEHYRSDRPISHVILHTPDFVPIKIEELATTWPNIEFVQLNHSGLAFLDLNKDGVKHIRETLDLQQVHGNVRVAGNNNRFRRMIDTVIKPTIPALYLPNLYYWEQFPRTAVRHVHDPLRIGSFGCGRDWKNQPIAAQAAVALGGRKRALELHTNIDPYNTYKRVMEGRRQLLAGLPNAHLIEHAWMPWPQFRRLVASMDILLSPSFDETFCVVCADGLVEGVPTVGSDAMEWLPESWRCRSPHDPESIAATARALLYDLPGTVEDGRQALTEYVESGTRRWLDYLTQ